ncbi:hypothetical protein V9L05_22220 (plasmid) [Bernardetia sp. Wsw4-3y2]|uniref:hypothetical protein n=1 Tax=Bernardetia sp. Wsw4-3y2 TaxID=3127471 RepID=UPI0030D39B8B
MTSTKSVRQLHETPLTLTKIIMKNKIYISLFLWLSFIILVVSYFTQNTEKECQALKETQNTFLKSHKKMYNDKFNSMELYIDGLGNNPRDFLIQNKIQEGESLLDSMFVKGKIENERILPFLRTHYYSMGEVNDTKKILKGLEIYKGNNKMLQQVNLIDRYQTSFYYLYEHHKEIGDFRIRYSKTNIINVSDTTLGFEFLGRYEGVVLTPENKVYWMMDSSKKLIGIKTDTYTKEDTITKMYKVIPSKNGKINPFDYEEVELDK